ncbi:uncharacterized protein LOC110981601 isoform X1 [Acanthaster planci]|uniref:Uncharacterized protein LOC110981601 isoform X1 n=1 Tax=Acanthaster planci TaxID=133434 RepID=A0A8B7YNX8_ACAPL|nr:uncharacterized protein LOC110981601 isoform X1 [Acanthaster planci]
MLRPCNVRTRYYLPGPLSYSSCRNMARTELFDLTKSSIYLMVLSIFLRYVSSQSCTAPLLQNCTCNDTIFECTSAGWTEFPSDLPNRESLQVIDLSNNSITTISTDVLDEYIQLQTLILARNGLTSIVNQTLPEGFTQIDLRSNPVVCDSSLAWLAGKTVLGNCANGQEISSYLDSLRATAGPLAAGPTQPNHTADAQTQPMTDAQSQPMTDAPSQLVTDARSQPMTTLAMGGTTKQPEEPNNLYILAIVIPVLVIVVICIAVVIFTRKNRKQQETYNSSIRYSVVRKDAGAGNRVYSDVTTEL